MQYATFNRFEIALTEDEARTGYHTGDCDCDVAELRKVPHIAAQLSQLDPADGYAELDEYGCWDETELADHEASLDRILWIACGNVVDELYEASKGE
jgi:hypothetical protein